MSDTLEAPAELPKGSVGLVRLQFTLFPHDMPAGMMEDVMDTINSAKFESVISDYRIDFTRRGGEIEFDLTARHPHEFKFLELIAETIKKAQGKDGNKPD
jgi:hypothetical protein